MWFIALTLTAALAGDTKLPSTDAASTLTKNVGKAYALKIPDIEGESRIASISCMAETASKLACTAYDAKGVKLDYVIKSMKGDTVTFEDPLFGRKGFENPLVGITLKGVGDTFTKTSTSRVPLK